MSNRSVHLLGRVFLTGNIETKTGLRIGDSQSNLTIGGVDLPVIRNRQNNQPYIPGSSLKGKLRSLSEKYCQAPLNFTIHRGKQPTGQGKVEIHIAQSQEDYDHSRYGWISKVFGTTGDAGDFIKHPNRLIVRDVMLDPKSQDELYKLKTDLPYTEVKWEAAIDRVTSAATPRQIERVPAGAVFGPMELVFNFYQPTDTVLFAHLLTALKLLEDDYLGGHGSRGSGKIAFNALKVFLRKGADYHEVKDEQRFYLPKGLTLAELTAKDKKKDLLQWVVDEFSQKEG